MKYKLKEGIVITPVCGVHLLVPLRTLWEEKLPVRRIPKGIALALQMASKGLSEQGTIDFIALLSRNADKEMLREKLEESMEVLYQAGYLEKVGDAEESKMG